MSLVKEKPKLFSIFSQVRNSTEQLVEPLSAEDMQVQTMPDVSPSKWHLAHTTWFFETFLLKEHLDGYREFHPQYNYLFNSYYNSVGDQFKRAKRGNLSRPSIKEVFAYREYVNEAMQVLLESKSSKEIIDLTMLGLNHEEQHQELMLTDIKHVLGTNPLKPVYRRELEPAADLKEEPMEWQDYQAGDFQLGHKEAEGFAFDNESPCHQVHLAPFSVASRLVTNREYLEFINDNAYSRPELWLSDAWTWIQEEKITQPLYWSLSGAEWSRYSLRGDAVLNLNQPVSHISFYEADAYATWANARLLREAEWEFAVTQLKANCRKNDFYGNLWQWTSSPYTAYPGYKASKDALGEYNGKFMSNQMVLKGGSGLSPQGHLRRTYRNFFYPTARWQFTGIRLARDIDG